MKNIILISLIALVFLISCTQQKSDDQIKPGTMIEKSSDVMEKPGNNYQGEILAGSITPYIDFNEADYQKAQAENKIILLNFYANWCPICKKEEPNAFKAYNQMNNQNVVAFRVNYKDSDTDDFEKQLAKDFGITYQHTKVLIKDGQVKKKDLGSWSTEEYINEINKVV